MSGLGKNNVTQISEPNKDTFMEENVIEYDPTEKTKYVPEI